MYAVIPIALLLSKSVSPVAKLLYGYLSSVVGRNGRYGFNLHHFSLVLGVEHYIIKLSLNELAKEKYIWRIKDEISLYEIDTSKADRQLELDMSFVNQITRTWDKVFKKDIPVGTKPTSNLTGAISDALLSFSKDELIEVIDKWHKFCSESGEWWGKPENKIHKTNAFKFFSNSERLNQMLNYTGRGSDIVIQRDASEDSGLLK